MDAISEVCLDEVDTSVMVLDNHIVGSGDLVSLNFCVLDVLGVSRTSVTRDTLWNLGMDIGVAANW